MKKIVSVILAVLLVCTMFPLTGFAVIKAQFGDLILSHGSGTKDDPYIISSYEKLKALADEVNDENYNFEGISFKLTTNPVHPLKAPIGTKEYPFKGNFDGGGFIVWLEINQPDKNNVGLFGYADGSEIKNVYWQGFVTGNNNVGGICGYCKNGTISNCGYKTILNMDGKVSAMGSYVGGICGYAENSYISDCTYTETVTKKYGSNSGLEGMVGFAGGICGYISGTIENCRNTGTIECGTEEFHEQSNDGYPRLSDGRDFAGGICGYAEATIRNCVNKGSVFGESAVGGIVGRVDKSNGIVANCTNEGEIYGASQHIGGIGGCLSVDSIMNCINTGTVIEPSSTDSCGGLASMIMCPNLINCISTGDFLPTTNGFYGSFGADTLIVTIENSYFNKDICIMGDAIGTSGRLTEYGRTTDELKSDEMLNLLNEYADEYSLLHWVRKENGYPGIDYTAQTENLLLGSTLSEGNVWIVAGIGAVAVVSVAVIITLKKKKKTA